jgi:serine/threonine-protein kinase
MEDQEPLGQEYLLHEEIGRGAHAVVRRATSRLGGPPLAAKLLKPEYAGDRRVRELFIREEAALRDLEHSSIVGIRDVVVERGRLALLMDYVDGPNLRRHLTDRGGQLPPHEAAWIAAQAAAALAVAHVQGVVHLDLKPENILVVRGTDPTLIRITDFGVAALLFDADPAVIGGTPGYMAPEVVQGGTATAAADVYSLGVVLREMLAGNLPVPLDDLVAACLATDPRSRPSARSLAIRLRDARAALIGGAPAPSPAPEAALAGAAMAAGDNRDTRLRNGGVAQPPETPPPPPTRPSRWRRGPLLTLAAGVVAAALLTGITVSAAAGQRDAVVVAPVVTTASATTPATVPPAAEPSAIATSTAPATKPPADPLADRTRATFAGHVDNGGGTLAISLRDGVAIAYICDGKRVESWLKGTAAAGKLSLTGEDGSKITGTFDAKRARGQVTVAGRTNDFDIKIAKKPSGLYRAAAKVRNATVVGSWIVLQDGKQVGVLVNAGVPGPAPALDVTGRATTVDGARVPTSTIDVDSGEGF